MLKVVLDIYNIYAVEQSALSRFYTCQSRTPFKQILCVNCQESPILTLRSYTLATSTEHIFCCGTTEQIFLTYLNLYYNFNISFHNIFRHILENAVYQPMDSRDLVPARNQPM